MIAGCGSAIRLERARESDFEFAISRSNPPASATHSCLRRDFPSDGRRGRNSRLFAHLNLSPELRFADLKEEIAKSPRIFPFLRRLSAGTGSITVNRRPTLTLHLQDRSIT